MDMAEKIEEFSGALVLADPSDLPALAALHTQLEEFEAWAREKSLDRTASAIKRGADLIEKIILGEISEPSKALVTLGQLASALQSAIRDGRPETEITLPPELEDAREVSIQASGVALPSFVDDTIFADFLMRQESMLEEMEAFLLRLDQGEAASVLPEIRRQLHTLKGESALLGLSDIEMLCHTAEDALSGETPRVSADVLLNLKDWLKRTFDAYAGRGGVCEAPGELLSQLKGEPAPDGRGAAPVSPGGRTSGKPAPETTQLHFEAKPLEGDKGLLADFIQEATEHLDNADLQLLTLETDPSNADAINAVFRAFHTIKGVAGFLALDEIQALAHEAENLLDQARKEVLVLSGKVIDLVFDAVDTLKRCIGNVSNALAAEDLLVPVENLPALVQQIKELSQGEAPVKAAPRSAPASGAARKLGEILVESGITTESAVVQALGRQNAPLAPKKLGEILIEENVASSKKISAALEAQGKESEPKRLGEVLVDLGAAEPEEIAAALEKQKSGPTPAKLGELLVKAGEADPRDVAQAIRAQSGQAAGGAGAVQMREAVKVDADRLDLLVDMIGELVIAESMVAQSPEMRRHRTTDLGRHVSQLDKITRELQVMAMSLRMVPVRSTFQKMARLVRDLAKKTNKPVEFHMSGEDTELDKTVVDKIGDPLVHMVRNAVDHGIEDSPAARRQAGKPPAGNVHLRAFHEGGNIHIEVEDDGRGLDRDTIVKKGVERGLISAADSLSDREIWNLIFEPGFSTAQVVTAVSGRGVGMDVVKRNIEALRGHVEIVSRPGQGCVFTIQLPLTLAIIDGMVVRVGSERYVLPTLSIVISLRPTPNEINTVVGRGEMLSLQGRLLPLFRLYQTLEIGGAVKDPCEGTVVVVESDGARVGLLVDEILGQQQIVIKSLGESLRGLPGIAGGAIMPDGRVGLILDVGGLVRLAGQGSAR